ncbi:5'-methylthioadenosine/S-adenosylhomocysteine nucleosidase [Salirhabdus salicampi]|uniref:5'-methylthioadenosine/S-adenosylhomocysteine nucleosidase n=1 Tax=Salirhabdus salicampi TaxID=476102 RepID=UPI0020C401EC|nr:5'-methylthioadenosine/S-adenosylhomocysteine nucleosidase [Salirhabdus salicampi]MCP8616948.1 5'-methylthioadenosine/S-adenosylhomocysteine nucleosidase [Salirhabdus salicampi]
MTIGIIGAMDEEIRLLKKEMDVKEEVEIAGCQLYKGTLSGKEIVLLKSGIGKVNAAMSTTILHEQCKPSVVVNTGSAGGFAKDLEVGDLVISDRVVYHDVDVTAFDYEYGQVPAMPPYYEADKKLISLAIEATEHVKGMNAKKGLIATGDSFMSDPGRVEFVRHKFPTMEAAEMEAAAIAQVCYHYRTPFVIIRALSDIAGKESSVSFEKFIDQAGRHSASLIMNMIKKL